VNCQLHFDQELGYKEHYKSEHHRYNVKRKLIALPPLSLQDYILRTFKNHLEFQTELSSTSQSNSEIYCEVCSKKFMSPQTYKQHINSQKHK
jgi:pre-60S factor REI1